MNMASAFEFEDTEFEKGMQEQERAVLISA